MRIVARVNEYQREVRVRVLRFLCQHHARPARADVAHGVGEPMIVGVARNRALVDEDRLYLPCDIGSRTDRGAFRQPHLDEELVARSRREELRADKRQ